MIETDVVLQLQMNCITEYNCITALLLYYNYKFFTLNKLMTVMETDVYYNYKFFTLNMLNRVIETDVVLQLQMFHVEQVKESDRN